MPADCAVEKPLDCADNTLWRLISQRAEVTPNKTMVVDEYEHSLTFGEFLAQAAQMACGLITLGVKPGSTVSWQLPSRIETVLLMAALARLDVRQVPMLPAYREREVKFLLNETCPEFLFLPVAFQGFDYVAMIERLAAALGRPPKVMVVNAGLLKSDRVDLPRQASFNEKERWIFATSGTTSNPKGVCHSDRSLLMTAIALGEALETTGADVGTLNFPIAHGGGAVNLMHSLVFGMKIVLTEKFEADKAVSLYRRHSVSVAGTGLPYYLGYLAEQRKRPREKIMPSLRLISGGAGPMPSSVYYQVKNEVGVPVAHAYGMTEGLVLAQGLPSDSDARLAASEMKPLRGAEFRVVSIDGGTVDTGEEGEILVRGPMLFKRYTDPELTARAFNQDGFFRTGDCGRLTEDGRIVITGRLKDIIIRKGENISAIEIENVLYRHPKIKEAAVIGLTDDLRGERVCAVVVTKPGTVFTHNELAETCQKAGLAKYKIPEQLESVAELPRNAMTKVLKTSLREEMSKRPWPVDD